MKPKIRLTTPQESILCRMINGAVLRWTPTGYVCGEVKVRDSRTIHGLQAHGLIDRADRSGHLFEVTEAGRELVR